jgi:methylated-DNA-protein-cysteine methyltransferase related protein
VTSKIGGTVAPEAEVPVDEDLAARILDVVASIPRGSVSTYGQVAALAGSPSPRLAGWVLAHLSDDAVPWHRVVRANGTPAPHLVDEQSRRLAADGVVVTDGRVNLRRYRWQPDD